MEHGFIPPPPSPCLANAGHTPCPGQARRLSVQTPMWLPPNLQSPADLFSSTPLYNWGSPFQCAGPALSPSAVRPGLPALSRSISTASSDCQHYATAVRFPAQETAQHVYSPFTPVAGFPQPAIPPPYMTGTQDPPQTPRRKRRQHRTRRHSLPMISMPAETGGMLYPAQLQQTATAQPMELVGADIKLPWSWCDPDNINDRPSYWRRDYFARRNLLQRTTDAFTNAANRAKPLFIPLLSMDDEALPPVSMDLRSIHDPIIHFPVLAREGNEMDFMQLATNPPLPHLTLYHPKLPWLLTINASSPDNGISVKDIIAGICSELKEPIKIKPKDRERIGYAYFKRTNGDVQEALKGVRRVDFLMRDCIMLGLRRMKKKVGGREDVWEIVTTPVPPGQ
ncbi:hypothetical protein DL96DRAFT_1594668 [Flagelloscypha sp. PMI_526]|nr:hypothetical protein DL96DRAFT_1594668 [Flagelloscypha sp. PMI_526]